ncbi:putative E3 ubiquitin-protein ligase ipaH4.5 [compost metagenome]
MLVGLRVQALPAGFLDCFPDLRRLDLSNNDLRTIPDGLGRLTRLRHLRLANNRIRLTQANTSALAGLPHLRTLDLSENALGTVRLQFNQLSRLRELRLFRSGLQAVPEGLEWCGLLEHVDLRNNQIATLPQVLLDAPHTLRQVLQVDGNPLPLALREQLYAPQPVPAQAPAQDPADGGARRAWLDATAEQEQVLRAGQWDNLQAEPGGESFFQLLAELTDSTDFRLARADLVRRVWTMIEAISGDTRMREDLFERAAAPRTCVDSMAHCFSQLEVRMHVLQVARDGDPLATRDARLLLAQRLFRLDQVEAFARADYLARPQEGHDVDEVEVSLAYRIGLAQRLNLLGQPRTMQFRPVAGVTQAQLDRAYRAVLAAEAGDERIRYISQRDFWVSYLRARHPQAFAQVSDGFDRAMEALDEEKQTLGSGAYKQRCDQLKSTTEQAFEALALRLTEDELNMPLPGSSQAPGLQGPLPSAT